VKREQILLLLTLALVALLTWGLMGGDHTPKTVRPKKRSLDLPVIGAVDPVAGLGAAGRLRDPFREPREVEPLAPLQLPSPPLGELASLLPPPIPDAGPAHWSRSLLIHPPLPAGDIDELVEIDGGDEPSGFAAVTGDAGEGDDFAAQYDQLRLGGRTVLWGRILNDDRYELVAGRDTIRFQEVDPRTGADRFGEQEYDPERYKGFAFAQTLRNEIELGVRALNPSAGAIRERLDYVRWLLAQGLLEPAAFEHAERLAREAVVLAPNDIATWMVLGEVWESTFRFDDAFTLYAALTGQDLAAQAPELGIEVERGAFQRRSAPFVRMGRILERFGLAAEAAAQYQRGVDLADGDPAAAMARGESLIELGQATEAAALLQRSLGFHASRSSVDGLRHGRALGLARLRAGDFGAALAAYRDVQSAAGGAAGGLEGSCGEVAALYLAGDFSGALRAVEQGIQTYGSGWKLLYLRGVTGAAAGSTAAEVIRDLRAAAAAAPFDAAPVLAAEAFWLDRLGHPEQARERLAEALELEPELPYGLYLRGRWARRDGDVESARADFRALIGMSSQCAAALGELGWLLHEEGRYSLAEVALRRAEAEAGDWTEISLRRGLNLLAGGEPGQARQALVRASGGDQGAAVRNATAWASYLEGDVPSAVAEYALLLDSMPGQEEHPQVVHAALWQQRVAAHAKLVRWIDGFEGKMPRPQWDVQTGARNGIEPRLVGGVLRIRGTHQATSESVTRATRKVQALDFRSLTAEFAVGAEQRGEGGVMLSLENRRGMPTWQFRVYRDSQGQLRWMTQRGTAEAERGAVPASVAAGAPVPVGFALDREQNPPVLTVTVAGEAIYAEPVSTLRSPNGDLVISLFARTLNALPVDVSLDNLELVYALDR